LQDATGLARNVLGRAYREVPVADRRPRLKREWLRRVVQLTSLVAFITLTAIAPWLAIDWLPNQLFSRIDPLVGLTAVIASRGWIAYASLGLISAGVAVAFGRVWCGWVCPVGTSLDLVPARGGREGADVAPWWRIGKYGTLAIVVGAALFGSLAPMILDPVTMGMRPVQEIIMPALGSDAVGQSAGTFISREAITGVMYLSLAPLAIVLGLSGVTRRFWCRSLCPLGGLQSILSAPAFIRRRVDTGACTSCGRCAEGCAMSAIDAEEGFASSSSECTVCMHCRDNCPAGAIYFGPRTLGPSHLSYVPERREAFALMGLTGASLTTMLVLPLAARAQQILRPPATDEARLAELCVRCGACYTACPTGALHPSTSLTSASGLWTPMLYERPGHCTLDCNLCAKVCPTDAIHTPTRSEALAWGLGGIARVDRGRCVGWLKGSYCMECQAVCPILGAITTTQETAIWHGIERTTSVPHVDPELCVACGLCTAACITAPPSIMVG
jgi:ferredoxin